MGKLVRGVVVAVVSIALFAGAAPARAATSTEAYAEAKLLDIVNDARQAKGLYRLRNHSYILSQARGHSSYMASRNTISHDGFNTRWSRIRSYDSGVRSMCENVAYARGYRTVDAAMVAIYNWWRNSSSHYKCMFDQFGFQTRSGAVGALYRNGTWWVTFEAAQDSTP